VIAEFSKKLHKFPIREEFLLGKNAKESMKFYGDFMKRYRLSVVVEKDADGYFVFCPELQGCYSKGDTYKEALETIKDAIRFHISCISISGSSMN
jgi:hypothetical protein